jgi:hypothetical protein
MTSLFFYRKVSALSSEMSLLEQILNFERQSSAEMLLLLDLGVFPASELAVSRRELQILRDSLDSDRKIMESDDSNFDESGAQRDSDILFASVEQELQITEKKNLLLKGRRMDSQRDHAVGATGVDLLYSVEAPDNAKYSSVSGGVPPRRGTRNVNRF